MNRDYLTAQSVTSFGQGNQCGTDVAHYLRRTHGAIVREFDDSGHDANRDETVAIAKAMNQVKVHICERNLKAYLLHL